MIIGFNERFVPKILSGEKIHTIREDAHNRWSPGRIMNMATGVRTKKYHEFATSICTLTVPIIINPEKERVLIENGSGLVYRYDGVLAFAKNDGFDTLEDFWKWFHEYQERKLIYWAPLSTIGRAKL
ncbi:hypothetical protein [Leptospira bandrabouensis]|uniref:hypothetical protein n=1 Tax=Leptospira bandrabouensis TaxID=2484903 RepID=UPI001091561D|nr:hypothetical protein [Leptospira bandrabouensis]TGN08588.1 hypothetical protein EHR07_03465 [Leptospira bandrabouensis]